MSSNKNADYWIEKLQLLSHPEGGFYKETYRSGELIESDALPNRYGSSRSFSTAIYFLLKTGEVSKFHKIKSDEIWFYHQGSPVEIYILVENQLKTIVLGSNLEKGEVFQAIIPKDCWFGAKVLEIDSFTLVSCTVSPGFDFLDFELAQRRSLLKDFPQFVSIIEELT